MMHFLVHFVYCQAIQQLLEVEEQRREGAYDGTTMCVGIARLQVCHEKCSWQALRGQAPAIVYSNSNNSYIIAAPAG
jgi:diphthamide biosynthesis methyltransferase